MSSIHPLQTRLKNLSASLNEIQPLIDRLRNFTHAIGQGDEARLELGSEIHSRLKEAEEEMELLRVEVDMLESAGTARRRGGGEPDDRDAERKRVVSLAEKLTGDLKRIRGDFRSAQLQANRNAEAARRKEREILFSRSRSNESSQERQRAPAGKLSHDDVVLNASSDVTAALRRTHMLMQSELSRSRFAQETLEQSTAALASLTESYSSLDSALSSSRALVNSLLHSQKSDTWYLETAFYILIGTIAWLVFRRILYGPLWWLAWMPVKMFYRFLLAPLLGIASVGVTPTSTSLVTSAQTVAATASTGVPTFIPEERATGGNPDTADTPKDSMVEEIGRMADEAEKNDIKVDTASQTFEEYDGPRNPKKRMMEKDEL